MLLPTNPEAKSPHDLDFADSQVDAVRYIFRELSAITVFASRVITFLVERYGGFKGTTVSPDGILEFRPPLQIGLNSKRPNPLPILDEETMLPVIRSEVEKALSRAAENSSN